MSVLDCHDLRVGYTKAPVLHGVSMEVAAGEIVGILGANGAGKTTLLRCLAGMLKPWSGEVTLAGNVVTRTSPWRRVARGLVHVPEGRHVFGPMTVEENLRVASLVSKRGAEGLEFVYSLFPRLAERRSQRASTLSGGEQQMLAIGRGLVTAPRVLMVDEMSAGLDPIVTSELLRGLQAYHDEQRTALVLVEQNPHLLEDVVDRLYLLEHGQVARQGTLAAVGGADSIADLYLGVK